MDFKFLAKTAKRKTIHGELNSFSCVNLTSMNCNLRFREEKIAAILRVPRVSETPSKRMHWVQCKGSKCLAVTDAGGKWHCLITGEDLAGHITKVHSSN
jgi:hypothetical protein